MSDLCTECGSYDVKENNNGHKDKKTQACTKAGQGQKEDA